MTIRKPLFEEHSESTQTAVQSRNPAGLTTRAVQHQLAALGCERYAIGVREAATGRMMNLELADKVVVGRIPWLKHMNACGNDIYVMPAKGEAHGAVLLDDVSLATIETLKRDGLPPALIVETSPGNYQSWIKPARVIEPAVRTAIARYLAATYHADPNSAGCQHYGRLAGFTNRKPKHQRADGSQPWVLCRYSGGEFAPSGTALIAQAQQEATTARPERAQGPRVPVRVAPVTRPGSDGTATFCNLMTSLLTRFDDVSRCDFVAALKMTSAGYTAAAIEAAIHAGSPDLETRKRGHVDDYVHRTVTNATKAAKPRALRSRFGGRS